MSETRLSERRFAAILGALLLLTFYPALIGGQALFYRDYGFLGYPFAHFHRESFWNGEIPFWNPLIHCGAPFFAQWNTMVFYPGSLIYLIFPLPTSLAWFCVLHILLGGIGMRRLTLHWTNSEFGAAIAGISFALGGVMLGAAIYPNYLVALGWMPWVFLLTEKAAQTGRRNLALAALAGSMQMLSGAPELILMTWTVMGMLGVARLASDASAPCGMARRFFTVIALIAGICAFQLLPFFQLLAQSQRGAASDSGFWALPAWGWANFFVPLYSHFKTAQGVHVQAGQSFLPTYYLGIIPMWLAVLGVWQNRHWRTVTLVIAGLGAMLIAMGEQSPVYGMLKSVIPVGLARFPVKAVLILGFICPVLAAFGIRWWEQRITADCPLLRRRLLESSALIALIIVGVVAFSRAMPLFPNPDDLAISSGFVRLVFLAAAAAALFCWRRMSDALRRVMPMGCLALIWLDVMTHTPVLNPTIDAAAFQPNLARAYHQQKGTEFPEAGHGRAMLRPDAEMALHTRMVPKFFDDFVGQRLAMWGNLNLLDDLPKVNGAATLRSAAWNDVEYALYATTNGAHANLIRFLGVTQVTRRGELMIWEPVANAMPRITAGQRLSTVAPGSPAIWQRTNWNPKTDAYVHGLADPQLTNLPPAETSVTEVDCGNGRIQFSVDAPVATVAVVAESFYPGWSALVNDRATVVLPVNHAFMAVPVPAGRSVVELRYSEPGFGAGLLISALALTCCGWLWRKPMDLESLPDNDYVASGLTGIVPGVISL